MSLDEDRRRIGLSQIMIEVEDQQRVAQERFGDFASMHEAYGVLAEEMAELFDGVRLRQEDPNRAHIIHKEAIQVMAVAWRMAEQARRTFR